MRRQQIGWAGARWDKPPGGGYSGQRGCEKIAGDLSKTIFTFFEDTSGRAKTDVMLELVARAFLCGCRDVLGGS